MRDILIEQRRCCEFYDENFTPVNLNQLVVISNGVLEGERPVEGVRYKSPSHMSGWWLTTDQYNDDINTLKNIHFAHMILKRPDIAVYLALPFGYRFILGHENENVWLDTTIQDKE